MIFLKEFKIINIRLYRFYFNIKVKKNYFNCMLHQEKKKVVKSMRLVLIGC